MRFIDENTPMNEAAAALGKMGKGKKKTLTEADRQRRRDWGKKLNAFRQAKARSPAPPG